VRVILILMGLAGLAGWAGYAVRRRDRIASALLFLVAAAALAGLVGAFLDWF
jgi:hypothetical protein